jgi:hypothetical protein
MTWNELVRRVGILVMGNVLVPMPSMTNCMISCVVAGEWKDMAQKGMDIVSAIDPKSLFCPGIVLTRFVLDFVVCMT